MSRNLLLMIVATAVWVLVLPLAAMMAITSPMVFDAGESTLAWTMFVFGLGFPLACVLGPIAAWIAYGLKHRRLAWVAMAVPAAWVAGFAVAYPALGGIV